MAFIALDGIDGTGKSTQIQLLADWLRSTGWMVVRCQDPGNTPLGDQLREILLHQRGDMSAMAEALLFMASRAELIHRVIQPALDRKSIVISDRYLLATVVYQGYGGCLNVDEVWKLGRLAASGLEPELTLVLDMPIDAAQLRRSRDPDRMESRQRDFHERVRQGFLTEAARQPKRIRVIDGTGSIDEIHAAIRTEVGHVLATRSRP